MLRRFDNGLICLMKDGAAHVVSDVEWLLQPTYLAYFITTRTREMVTKAVLGAIRNNIELLNRGLSGQLRQTRFCCCPSLEVLTVG